MFFAGDDVTDLPAIEFAAAHGVGAFVQSDEQRDTTVGSAALIQDVDEVANLLSRLLERMAR